MLTRQSAQDTLPDGCEDGGNEERYSYIQIGNILIDEGEVSAVESVTDTEAFDFRVVDGALSLTEGLKRLYFIAWH